MTPGRGLRTPKDVQAAWRKERPLLDARELPALPAYVNEGRWVADCAACPGGIAGWPEHNLGACLSCGRVWTITYPQDIDRVEALLADRPLRNRNYEPHKGETLATLESENRLFLDLLTEPQMAAYTNLAAF